MTFLEALLNTLWQSALLVVLTWAALRWLPGVNAATRAAVWWAVLAIVIAMPFAQMGRRTTRPMPSLPIVIGAPVAQPAVFVPTAPSPARGSGVRIRRGTWVNALNALWFAVFIGQSARLFVSFFYLRRLKRAASLAPPDYLARFDALLRARGVRRRVRLLLSGRMATPVATGFLHPAVILPNSLPHHLTAEQLDHVLLHEIAHLARRDDWFHLASTFAWSFLALHPVAAWVLRRIEREREIACDDWVVAGTGAPRSYAASLARLFELCTSRRRVMLATGITGNGSQLGDRIASLLQRGRAFTAGVSVPRAGACVAMILFFAGLASQTPSWIAFAQTPGRPSQPSANPHSFLAAVVAAGYGDLSVDDIVNLKVQGVTGEYLAAISQAGWGKLPPHQIINLKIHGVQPEYPREIHALGFGPYTPDEVIHLRNQGVPVELFRGLKEYGIAQASPNDVIQARVHGLNTNHFREARSYGAKLNLHQIIKLKQAGVI